MRKRYFAVMICKQVNGVRLHAIFSQEKSVILQTSTLFLGHVLEMYNVCISSQHLLKFFDIATIITI